jgi:hypothetical protein
LRYKTTCLVEPHTGDVLNRSQTRVKGGAMNWYEIRVKGQLDQQWSTWFNGLTITDDGDKGTLLFGSLADEAALHGVLIKIRDLALPLLMVNRVEPNALMR